MRNEAPTSEIASSAETTRFVVLDVFRGLFALLVAVHNVNFGPWIPQLAFVAHSSLFVDFFFVLSGFVISHAYGERLRNFSDAAAFIVRRFGRLWPLQVVTLFCLVLLYFAKFVAAGLSHLELDANVAGGILLIRTIATNLLFVQIFDPKSWLSWNAPSWSISAEFWTYLTFAMCCLISQATRTRIIFSVAIAVAAAGVLLSQSSNFLETNTEFAFLRCLYGFFVGHLTYQAFRLLRAKSGSVLELLVVLLVVGYVAIVGNNVASMVAPGVFGFSVWVFAQEQGVISRSLKKPPLIKLGIWSYSIYMVHWIFRNLLVRANDAIAQLIAHHQIPGYFSMNEPQTRLIIIALYLIATLILASLTYTWIEQPWRRYFNRLAKNLSDPGDESEKHRTPIGGISPG
jgi:peptidoglycan/LPS O-acetylase OafA/YrhL